MEYVNTISLSIPFLY